MQFVYPELPSDFGYALWGTQAYILLRATAGTLLFDKQTVEIGAPATIRHFGKQIRERGGNLLDVLGLRAEFQFEQMQQAQLGFGETIESSIQLRVALRDFGLFRFARTVNAVGMCVGCQQ